MAHTTVAPDTTRPHPIRGHRVRSLATVAMILFALLALATAPAFAAPANPVGPGEVAQPVEPPNPEPKPAVEPGADEVAIPEDDPCWEWGNCPPPPPPDPEECNPFVLNCDDPVIAPCEQDCGPGHGPDDDPKDDPKDQPKNQPKDESGTGIPTPTRIDTGAGGSVNTGLGWWFALAGALSIGAVGIRRVVSAQEQR